MGLKVKLEVTGIADADAVVRAALARYKVSFRSLFAQLAESWIQDVLPGNIHAGGRPDPFAPLTLTAQRIRAFFYGPSRAAGPILIRRGDLINSLQIFALEDDQVVLGSRHFLARLHENGYVTAAGSRIPGKVVPARPWIHLAADAIEAAFQRVETFVGGEL